MKKFTIWIRLFSGLPKEKSERIAIAIDAVIRKYQGQNTGPSEYEISVPDDLRLATQAWNEFRNAVEQNAYFVWRRHENGGITAADFPNGFAEQLTELQKSFPKDVPQKIRDVIATIF